MTDLSSLLTAGTARSIGAAIASGKVTSTEVTKWYLLRIDKFNGGAHGLNCVRSVSPLALEQASLADVDLGLAYGAGRCTGCHT
jgi:amidase